MLRAIRLPGLFGTALLLGACAVVERVQPPSEITPEVRGTGVTTDILVRPRARPAELQTPAPEPEVAAPVPQAGGVIGTTVASLGNPAEAGLWIKTPLVKTEQAGRVRYPDTGKTVAVTLIPLDGPVTAGSQLSLAAMQALGAPLAGLPTVEVLAAV
jgi:hypothetical protein